MTWSGNAGAILVVGGDGVVGSSLAAELARRGEAVVRTTRRSDAPGVYLDLRQLGDWSPPGDVKLAFLCAGVTAMEACRRDSAGSRAVNVDAQAILADRLIKSGASVVFLSTDRVFDGSAPFRTPEAPTNPQTEYGRQKAEAEARLLQMGPSVCIVRCTKVLAAEAGLAWQWRAALKSGQPITPFSDMVMSPISLSFATDALCRIGLGRERGILHLSAAQDISYEQMARRMANRFGFSQSLIQPTSAAGKVEHLPAHTTLNTRRFQELSGVAAPDPWSAVDSAFQK